MFSGFTLAVFIALCWCLLVLQPFPLLHDFPEWVYQGWLFKQLLTQDGATGVRYALVTYPVPNSLSQAGVGLLTMVLEPATAAKIWLSGYLFGAALMCLNIWYRYKDSSQVLLLSVIVFFGPGFWNGYINFQYALLLFALYLSLSAGKRGAGYMTTLLCSLLIFFSHAVVFAIFVCYCVAGAFFRRGDDARNRFYSIVVLIPSLLLLGWYCVELMAAFSAGAADSMSLFKWVQYKAYTLAKQGPFHNFILHTGESLLEQADWFYKAGFIANFIFAAMLGFWFIWLLWVWLSRHMSPLRHPIPAELSVVLVCISVCFIVYLVAGANTFGVVNLGERFLIVALLMMLLLLRCPAVLQTAMATAAMVFMTYTLAALYYISGESFQAYAVDRSSASSDLSGYVDDIYANTRHQFFNHRLFIYADRGLELLKPEPGLLEIDLETSIIRRVK